MPSEAEWEYACRAGTQTRFYFGNAFGGNDDCGDGKAGVLPGARSDYMWYCGNNSPAGTPGYSAKEVGLKRPNGFGLYDMSGNLWEWCLDAYHPDYREAPSDGRSWKGPPGSARVLRGGSWDYYAKHCRSAARNGYRPERSYTFHGLRLVWFPYAKYSKEWFGTWEAEQIANNMLSYQNRYGSWPKNMNMEAHGYQGEKFTKNWGSSIDNNATTKQMKFLARVIDAQGGRKYIKAFRRGFNFLLEMQYDNGGWPQRYPPGHDYGDYITFNDNAMMNAVSLMCSIAQDPEFAFLRSEERERAGEAFQKGIECILDCQVKVDGELTGWGAQHDPETLQPKPARGFEPKGLSGDEGADVVLFLMKINGPSKRVQRAVESAVSWFRESRITGKRVVVKEGRKRLIDDPNASPIWARFYEIGTWKPIFADMDGVVKYSVQKIGSERAKGYRWFSRAPAKVLEKYPDWKERVRER